MKAWNTLVVPVALLTTTRGAHGFLFLAQLFNNCYDGDSCGRFGFSVVKHSTSVTGGCTDQCVFLPSPGLKCGSCANNIENEETSTPGYDIYYDLHGVPAIDTIVFINARERWKFVILSDLSDISSDVIETGSRCSLPSIIDDLYICGQYSSIDGEGGILGQAGPTYVRTSNSLTIAGEMKFDTEDIDSLRSENQLSVVMLREVGYIIGFGTLWERKGIIGTGSSCPYLGPKATAEFRQLSGCSAAVPTETDGGPGTACSHWNEACMGDELMTGALNYATFCPLSRVTIGAFEDLGYAVDYDQADFFSKIDLNPNCQCRRRSQEEMQFSLPKSAPRRRQLSDEGYQMAWDYGMSLLTERAEKYKSTASNQDENDTPEIQYVGHKVVTVLFEEAGEIYDVLVTNP